MKDCLVCGAPYVARTCSKYCPDCREQQDKLYRKEYGKKYRARIKQKKQEENAAAKKALEERLAKRRSKQNGTSTR